MLELLGSGGRYLALLQESFGLSGDFLDLSSVFNLGIFSSGLFDIQTVFETKLGLLSLELGLVRLLLGGLAVNDLSLALVGLCLLFSDLSLQLFGVCLRLELASILRSNLSWQFLALTLLWVLLDSFALRVLFRGFKTLLALLSISFCLCFLGILFCFVRCDFLGSGGQCFSLNILNSLDCVDLGKKSRLLDFFGLISSRGSGAGLSLSGGISS